MTPTPIYQQKILNEVQTLPKEALPYLRHMI